MSGWGCPEEANEYCQRLRRVCDPGSPGCLLYGRFRFLDPDKNPPRRAQKPAKKTPDNPANQPGRS